MEPCYGLAMQFKWLVKEDGMVRTMFIMTYELIKMPIARRSLVDRDPVCEPGKQRAWEFS